MKSLYDQNPEVWGELASKGRGCLASMAKKFVKCADMDRALGFQNETARWHGGRGFPAYGAENRAEHWLGGIVVPHAKQPPAAQKDAVPDMLLVVGPVVSLEKAKRLLAVLGCEVTEV